MQRSLKISLIIITLLAILPAAWGDNGNPSGSRKPPKQLIINGRTIHVEIADRPDRQAQDLSDRPFLPQDYGMLFIFPDKQVRTFWMLRMHFPLDIVWLDDNRVIKIDKNLPPEGAMPQKHYSSDRPVNYVLEVNAGLADKNKIKRGDKVIFK